MRYMSALLEMELRRAEEDFRLTQAEAIIELDRMDTSGVMNSSIIDRIMKASDRVTEARRKYMQYIAA